jgi:hypothetical protein
MGTAPAAARPALEHFSDAGLEVLRPAAHLGGEMAGENGRQLGGAQQD